MLSITGCGNHSELAPQAEDNINVVCVSFPEYDWTRQIIGDNKGNISLHLIVDNGVDIHNYQPSVEDMVQIDDCDLLIYTGGTSEQWIADAVADSDHSPKILSMMETLKDGMVEEEIVEGMEPEKHHHDHEEEHNHHQEHEEEYDQHQDHEEEAEDEIEYDEHIWLSLKQAQKMVREIADTLKELDKANQEQYEQNAQQYLAKLAALDKAYEKTVKNAKRTTLLFGDRFPFRYMTEDYGLTYYAAFPGCSSESEASFETIIFLANKVEEEKLPCILTIDGSNETIAKAIAENVTGFVKIQRLNSLQAINRKQIAQGVTYVSVMEQNLEVVKSALQ